VHLGLSVFFELETYLVDTFDSANECLLHLLHHLRHALFLSLRAQRPLEMVTENFNEQNKTIYNKMAFKSDIPDCIYENNI
jgi:hypothetical protein